ncbi:hypothetical protein RB595_006000 [Gaeumannomyces hyphopodioides]
MARLPFLRRQRDDDGSTLPTHNRRTRRRASSQSTKTSPLEPYSMRRRPTFMEWLKITLLDLITMAVLGALSLVIFRLHPPAHRSFPITFTPNAASGFGTISPGSGDVVYPQFAYPYQDQFIPSHAATVLAAGVPIATFLLAQIRIRSFWDLNNAIMGLLYSLITSALFQVTIKWLIGGLRPNFLSVCNPDTSLASRPGGNKTGLEGTGYGGIMYTYEVCRGDGNGDLSGVFNSLESFPSGHTTAAFAGFVYLYLYLNAKLKVFSNYHPSMWKLALTYAPILGATLIGGSLTVDQSHNWYDIVAGGIIGTIFALSSYRTVYAAIWDWRTNHIPLHRRKAFETTGDVVGMGWTMTRRAGWGRRRGANARGGEKLPALGENTSLPRDDDATRSRTNDTWTAKSSPQTAGTVNGGSLYRQGEGRVIPGTVGMPRVGESGRPDRGEPGADMV